MKKLTQFIFLILPFIISACGFYTPNLRNSPMLTKAGEVQGAVQISRGLQGQGAAAITDHIGIMSNYQYLRNKRDGEIEKRSFFEGGLGYFTNKGASFYEIYAGYGEGDVDLLQKGLLSAQGDAVFYSTQGRFNRIFIQPSFGYHSKRHSVAFAPRFSYVNVLTLETTNSDMSGMKDAWVAELAGIERWHVHQNIFLTFQGGVNLRISKERLGAQLIQLGGGIGFRFNAEKR